MSSVLPFDIISEIIDTIGKNKDTNLLKALASGLSHSFLQICSKHLFATVELFMTFVRSVHISHSSKKGFVKLLTVKADQMLLSSKYIRKLTYIVGGDIANHKLVCSHPPSFQISFRTIFLVSTASQSPLLRGSTGIHGTLPP